MIIAKQLFIGLLRVFFAVVIGSVIGGIVFAGIDWMRTFQSDSITMSVARTALASDPYNDVTSPALFAVTSKFIDWYSTLFFGYARFGAGLLMIAATFWAMGRAQAYHVIARGAIGFFAGFLIGTRLAMFVMSRPVLVLVIAVITGVLCAFAMIVANRRSRFEAVPKLQLKHQS